MLSRITYYSIVTFALGKVRSLNDKNFHIIDILKIDNDDLRIILCKRISLNVYIRTTCINIQGIHNENLKFEVIRDESSCSCVELLMKFSMKNLV